MDTIVPAQVIASAAHDDGNAVASENELRCFSGVIAESARCVFCFAARKNESAERPGYKTLSLQHCGPFDQNARRVTNLRLGR